MGGVLPCMRAIARGILTPHKAQRHGHVLLGAIARGAAASPSDSPHRLLMGYQLTMIALLGAVGTLCRYGLSGVVQHWCGANFPWGTLAVNALGCLLFGFMWQLAQEQEYLSAENGKLILVGFMGALTTFSTFAFDSGELLKQSQFLLVAANLLAQNGLGLVCLFLGQAAGRMY
jgi:CrcB protein